jgi:hypothetical protein
MIKECPKKGFENLPRLTPCVVNFKDREEIEATLLIAALNDGGTPVNMEFCDGVIRLHDPHFVVFTEGRSPMICTFIYWGKESDLRVYAARRNKLFSDLLHRTLRVNPKLLLKFGLLDGVGGDKKALWIELGLKGNSDPNCCTRCNLPHQKFGMMLLDPSYTSRNMQDFIDLMVMILFTMHQELKVYIDLHGGNIRPTKADLSARYCH